MDPIVNRKFTVSAPGRVCLFGEHQDYLGMPSIVMAVNLRCRIEIEERADRRVVWTSPKLGEEYYGEYDLDFLEDSVVDDLQDHKLAALILARDRGLLPKKGWNATIESDVPFQAGCSSSSALLVAWIASMQRLSGNITSRIELANQAFEAEVTYFNAPGGNMDQIACAVGGTLRVDPNATDGYVELQDPSFDFILGDSNVPKDTIGILSRCKFDRLNILESHGGDWDEIDISRLNQTDVGLVKGTIRNRDIERIAASKLGRVEVDNILGPLMSEHHGILRDVLDISTPRIELMCDAALSNGAIGAKIFGSGGGGCMLAMIERIKGFQDHETIAKVKSSIEAIDGTMAYHVVSEHGVSWGDETVNPVIILAAGASSRMKKVTGVDEVTAQELISRPKAMLRVGRKNTPFLDLLIRRIKSEGSNCVIVVIGENDTFTKEYFNANPIEGFDIRYAVQTTPSNRTKPLGTAQAVQISLAENKDLHSHSIVVCNGDNMPPKGSFSEIFKFDCAMLAYDSANLGMPNDRVSAFAVVRMSDDGSLEEIVEKPDANQIPNFIQDDGVLRVSMNIFKLPFSEFTQAVANCPMSKRNELELPIAIGIWNSENLGAMRAIPFSGEFLDLTHPSDFEFVLNKLQ
tara:strand:- start:4677 stop:6575 length:1899 start_codon:yes stop_codon:yes gene_type:complete